MTIEQCKKLATDFKAKHNDDPRNPLQIRYKWNGIEAEGELRGPMIFGYPGMVDIRDEEVTDVQILSDYLGRAG